MIIAKTTSHFNSDMLIEKQIFFLKIFQM